MKSIFKKSLVLVMLTGMVVAPVQAGFWDNHPKMAKLFGKTPATQPAPVATQSTPVVQATALVPVTTTSKPASTAVVPVKTAPTVVVQTPATPVAQPSLGARLKGWGKTVGSVVATPFVAAYDWVFKPSYDRVLAPVGNFIVDNRMTNWISEKSGSSKFGAAIGITAAVVAVAGLSYLTYSLISGKKRKSVGGRTATANSKNTATNGTNAGTPTVKIVTIDGAPVPASTLTAGHGEYVGNGANDLAKTAKDLVMPVSNATTTKERNRAFNALKTSVQAIITKLGGQHAVSQRLIKRIDDMAKSVQAFVDNVDNGTMNTKLTTQCTHLTAALTEMAQVK